MITSELQGAALDWAVAKCEGFKYVRIFNGDHTQIMVSNKKHESYYFHPTGNWAQGGPIIEREKISLNWCGSMYESVSEEFGHPPDRAVEVGLTPLIAAMRCYVASKLSDVVEIPEELK